MPIFVKVTHVPQKLLTALLMIICCAGAFALANSMFDLKVMLIFGIIAYYMGKLDLPAVPIVLGIILGPIVEANLRNSLVLSQGSYTIFFTRPISLAFILLTVAMIVMLKRSNRKQAKMEEKVIEKMNKSAEKNNL